MTSRPYSRTKPNSSHPAAARAVQARLLHPAGPQVQPTGAPCPSQLNQWPVQIKLAPIQAPYFQGARLLIAADCSAYAYGNFHQEFMQGHITLVGCPKLDGVDYGEKLAAILRTERHQKRDPHPHGSALLRRTGTSRCARAAAERQVHPLAGGHFVHRRPHFGPLNPMTGGSDHVYVLLSV